MKIILQLRRVMGIRTELQNGDELLVVTIPVNRLLLHSRLLFTGITVVVVVAAVVVVVKVKVNVDLYSALS